MALILMRNIDMSREAFSEWAEANFMYPNLIIEDGQFKSEDMEGLFDAYFVGCMDTAEQQSERIAGLEAEVMILQSDNFKLLQGIFPEHRARQFFGVIKGTHEIVEALNNNKGSDNGN